MIYLDLECQGLPIVHRCECGAQLLAHQTHSVPDRRSSSELFLAGQRASYRTLGIIIFNPSLGGMATFLKKD